MENFITLKEEDITEQVHVIHGDTLPSTLTSNPIFQALKAQVKPPYKEERELTVSNYPISLSTQFSAPGSTVNKGSFFFFQ